MVRARKAYKFLRSFEFEGFTVTTIAGFIPFPAPQFRRKRARSRQRSRKAVVRARPEPPKDPVVDTFENFRQNAMDEREYWQAFGAAIAQNMYEQGKKNQNPA